MNYEISFNAAFGQCSLFGFVSVSFCFHNDGLESTVYLTVLFILLWLTLHLFINLKNLNEEENGHFDAYIDKHQANLYVQHKENDLPYTISYIGQIILVFLCLEADSKTLIFCR